MLVEFSVENFLSFRDRQVFSMVASKDTTHPENTIACPALGDDMRLLKAAAIYGANASGKSNSLMAMGVLTRLVLSSLKTVGEIIRDTRFKLDASAHTKPSQFEISFVDDEALYRYGVTIDTAVVREEWLYAYPQGLPQKWFHRTTNEQTKRTTIQFGRNLRGEKKRLERLTRPETLFLSVAAQFNHEQILPVYLWFKNGVLGVGPESYETMTAQMSLKSPERKSAIVNFLKKADFGIEGIEIEEKTPDSVRNTVSEKLSGKVEFDIRVLHRCRGNDESVTFDLANESLGTQRYFSLVGPWIHALENGCSLLVDELDRSIHPLMAQTLIRSFMHLSSSRRPAQLIFNTHDTRLLDQSLLRRDQIWFVEKDRDGASHLYPLVDYRPRKGEALDKGYLAGRYGALPILPETMGIR